MEKDIRIYYGCKVRPVVKTVQPGITGKNENGDSQWVYVKPGNTLARTYNVT